MFPPYKPACRSTTPHPKNHPANSIDPSRASLKINIPPPDSPSLPFHDVERSCAQFNADYVAGSSLPPLGPSRSNGKVAMCGGAKAPGHGGGSSTVQFCNNNHHPTPSPAELANMLVRSSSHPHRMGGNQCGTFGLGMATAPPGVNAPQGNNRSSPPPATGGFQSFASALLSRLPMMPNQNVQCPHGATTNIALLAQFLASQLRAFVPTERGAHPPPADGIHPSPCRENKAAPPPPKDHANTLASNGQAPPSSGTTTQQAEKENYPQPTLFENGSPENETRNVKMSDMSGSHEKDESSSSANVANAAVAPSSGDGVDSAEQPNGGSELVFLVNRRSKTVRYFFVLDLTPSCSSSIVVFMNITLHSHDLFFVY